MSVTSDSDPKRIAIRQKQWAKLESLLQTVIPMNRFWEMALGPKSGVDLTSLESFLQTCPFLTKKDLVRDREATPPYGSNLTYPIENYTRFCQTSGTSGKPLAWLDSRDDWKAMLDCWDIIFNRARLEAGEDRLYFPFSFGPFLGFWTAFEAATRSGFLVLPGGGLSTQARLQAIWDHRCTTICTTPTYALHMGETKAIMTHIPHDQWPVRTIIVAGEPGGSLPEIRARIEAHWPGVFVFDHHGLTELGPLSYQDPRKPGNLIALEEHHIFEILDTATNREVLPGETGELVVTTLKRIGCPLFRYRTGDLVRKAYSRLGKLSFEGGVISRLDDMVQVRGVNIFPSAVDAVMQGIPGVAEYQVREKRRGALMDLAVFVEPTRQLNPTQATALKLQVENHLRNAFALRMPTNILRPGELPRFEFKARRWIKELRKTPES